MFEKKSAKRWRRDIWRVFQKAGFTPPEMMAVMVLAGVSAIGPNLEALSELTGLSQDYVRKVVRRLRKHRVLSGTTLNVSWDNEEYGWLGPVLDGLVASGSISRCVDPKRSEAAKKRAPEKRARGPRKKREKATEPIVQMKRRTSNPLYIYGGDDIIEGR